MWGTNMKRSTSLIAYRTHGESLEFNDKSDGTCDPPLVAMHVETFRCTKDFNRPTRSHGIHHSHCCFVCLGFFGGGASITSCSLTGGCECCRTRRLVISYRCSFGDRSGEHAGHSSTSIWHQVRFVGFWLYGIWRCHASK